MGGWGNKVDLDHIDFQYDWIERLIKAVADGMGNQLSQDELVEALRKRNVSDSDIFLIIKSAELLYKDRTSAPPKKTLIKRV